MSFCGRWFCFKLCIRRLILMQSWWWWRAVVWPWHLTFSAAEVEWFGTPPGGDVVARLGVTAVDHGRHVFLPAVWVDGVWDYLAEVILRRRRSSISLPLCCLVRASVRRLVVGVASGQSLPVGPDGTVQSRLDALLLGVERDRLGCSGLLLYVVLRARRLWRRQRMVMDPRVTVTGNVRQSHVVLLYREPVAEIGVAETPASNAVVPGLVAASDVVVGQLFHGFERVEATAVDRYRHKRTFNVIPPPRFLLCIIYVKKTYQYKTVCKDDVMILIL